MKSKTAEQIHAKWQEIWVTGKRPDLNANEHQIEMIKEYASQFQHPVYDASQPRNDLFDILINDIQENINGCAVNLDEAGLSEKERSHYKGAIIASKDILRKACELKEAYPFPVPDEAGEVYVWETKNPEQDLFRHPIINLTEKCHDLGWFDTKRGYWVDENGDSLGQCEWLRLSPAPPSGEDAGKGIGDLKQDLFDFFLWFRENGDLYIDKSIENMISIYIKTIHTNV